ncbi:hypothetical protein Tco_0554290 [Tanacetum coccineum]
MLKSPSTFPIPVEDTIIRKRRVVATTHADNSLPEYDSFLFETETDQGELTSVVIEEILGEPRVPNVFPTHSTLYLDSDFAPSDDSLEPDLVVSFPSGTRNKIFDPGIFFEVQSKRFLSRDTFSISFICNPLCPVIETLLPFSSENEDQIFNPRILYSNLLSHLGKITSDFSKSPMMISGGDIPILDVLYRIFTKRQKSSQNGQNRALDWKEREKVKVKVKDKAESEEILNGPTQHEEYISLLERLLYDNSSPRLPEDFHANPNTIIESLPTFTIPVEDSDSLREEIDIFLGLDDSIPPGIESDDYDSKGDDNSTSLPEFESFHVDYPNPGDSTIDVVEDIPIDVPNILPTHPTLHMDFDFIPSHNDLGSDLDISSPFRDRNKIYDPGICIEVESTIFLATFSPMIDTLLPFSSENKYKVFNHGVLASKEKSPPSSSHRGFKSSKPFHHKSPMLI